MLTCCPLCGAETSLPFLVRRQVPVLQNAPRKSAAAAREVQRGDLSITVCARCGFVFNAAFDWSLMAYEQTYDNTQSHSGLFDDYITQVANHLIERYGVRGKLVVEVGCGKGHFLRRICEVGSNRGIGFDPTYAGPDEEAGGRIRFVREFFGEASASVGADLVCCRHVLEHVPNPVVFLRNIRKALAGSPAVVLFFEVPTVEWILDEGAFWDFYYEHCSYFCVASLAFALESAGFEVLNTRDAFGGQYIWIEARAVADTRSAEPGGSGPITEKIKRYTEISRDRLSLCGAKMEEYWEAGGCAVWGAGAKGVTLLNALDPDCERVGYVVDINPAKQGKHVPGTGHRIVGPSETSANPPAGVIITNPNYADEICIELRHRVGAPVRVHSL